MATLIFLFLSLSLPVFLLFVLKKNRTSEQARYPPGPPGLPFIGNFHQLDNTHFPKYLWRLSQKYGPLMSLRIGVKRIVIVSSAKMASEILKTHDLELCSRPAFTATQKISYNGLDLAFSPYGPYWRELRKTYVVHLLSSVRVQSFRPIREEEVLLLNEKIYKAALASKPINLTEAMMSLTSTTICRAAFGRGFEDGGSEKNRFKELLTEAQALLGSFFFSDYFPYFDWLDKLTGLVLRLEKNFKEFDVFYQEIIDEHLDPKQPKADHKDILDVLLQIYKDRTFTIQLTLDHIKAILMNIFIAGTETSAATVIWAMSFLMKDPETMRKAQEEVRNLIGEKDFVNEDDVQQLPYLKNVVKETMRLQPTGPLLLPREAIDKGNIGVYEIPANTIIYVNAYAIGRDPETWENPCEFNPDRFLDSSIDFKGQDFELIPFGAGRRICPGMFMGIATVELSLANLLHKFDWEMPFGMKRESIDIDHVLPGPVMHKSDALCLVPMAMI